MYKGAFTPTARFRVLQPRTTDMQEPDNLNFKSPQSSTIEEENSELFPLKYYVEENFDVPGFEAMKGVHVVHRRSGCKKYKDGLYAIDKLQRY